MTQSLEEMRDTLRKLENEIYNFVLEVDDYADEFEDMLDNEGDDIEILGGSFCASTVLKELDPIAYNEGLANYVDSVDVEEIEEYQELIEKKENLELEIEELEEVEVNET